MCSNFWWLSTGLLTNCLSLIQIVCSLQWTFTQWSSSDSSMGVFPFLGGCKPKILSRLLVCSCMPATWCNFFLSQFCTAGFCNVAFGLWFHGQLLEFCTAFSASPERDGIKARAVPKHAESQTAQIGHFDHQIDFNTLFCAGFAQGMVLSEEHCAICACHFSTTTSHQ